MNIKRLVMLMVLVVPVAMIAQVRIATVDVQSIFEAMPETKAATDVLNALSEQLHNEYAMMQQEFNGKYAAYQALAASDTPATIRDRRVREIQDGNREIEDFLAASQESLAKKKKELEAPIYAKINEAIKQVGDSGGYTYIFDVSAMPVVYAGAGAVDLTTAVKKWLGLE